MLSVYRIVLFVQNLFLKEVLRKENYRLSGMPEYIPVGGKRNFGFYDHK